MRESKQLPPDLVERMDELIFNELQSQGIVELFLLTQIVGAISDKCAKIAVDYAEEEKWKFIKSELDFHKKQAEIYKRQAIHFKNDSQVYYLAGKQQSHHYHVCLYLEQLVNAKNHEDENTQS